MTINLTRMFTVDEGCKIRVYNDTNLNKTVGIGFNMDSDKARDIWQQAGVKEIFTSVYMGDTTLSMESIWALLNACVDNCKEELRDIFPDFDTYPDYVQMALINLDFNLGATKFSKFNTFISLIKAGNINGASDDLATTGWAKQLPARAKRVCELLKGNELGYTKC